mgnify:CR=1 FL=1
MGESFGDSPTITMNKTDLIVTGVLAILLLVIGGYCGWSLHKTLKPCPVITHDTITIEDPYWHNIADSLAGLPPEEVIKWLPQDTLYIPGDSIPMKVDTAAILKDYFSVYKYKWEKKTDTLTANLETTVTRNMPIKYDLKYKINVPFTTVVNSVDNSVAYNSYLQFGLFMPVYKLDKSKVNIQDLGLEGTYIFPKSYIGASWQPNTQSIMARTGVTLFKFKK